MPKQSSKRVSGKGLSSGAIPKHLGGASAKNSRKRQRITSEDEAQPLLDIVVEAGTSSAGRVEEVGESSKGRNILGESSKGRSSRPRVKDDHHGNKPKSRGREPRPKRESQSHEVDCCRSELRRCRQKLRKMEVDKRKIEEKLSAKRKLLATEQELNCRVKRDLEKSGRDLEKAKREKNRIKAANEKLMKESADQNAAATNEATRWKQKVDGLKKKMSKIELEKVKLESKMSSLQVGGLDPGAGPSSGESGGLFQDMMDNFRELAESQLQCAVCNELFVESVSINCGHTFCGFCIEQWKKKKNNCPVCRADITQQADVKVLDEYVDKVYEQFVGEGGKQQRKLLKEEREKAKKDAIAKAQQRSAQRRERAEARINNGLELVNIVLNRSGRTRDDDESSLDSDATLELHLSDAISINDGSVSDAISVDDGDMVRRNRLMEDVIERELNSDSDSSDSSGFLSVASRNAERSLSMASDTDSIPDTTSDRTDSSSSSSDTESRSSSSSDSSDSDSDF